MLCQEQHKVWLFFIRVADSRVRCERSEEVLLGYAVSEARKYSWGTKLAFGCFVVYQVYLKGSDVAF